MRAPSPEGGSIIAVIILAWLALGVVGYVVLSLLVAGALHVVCKVFVDGAPSSFDDTCPDGENWYEWQTLSPNERRQTWESRRAARRARRQEVRHDG